jgi:hypothetical protein
VCSVAVLEDELVAAPEFKLELATDKLVELAANAIVDVDVTAVVIVAVVLGLVLASETCGFCWRQNEDWHLSNHTWLSAVVTSVTRSDSWKRICIPWAPMPPDAVSKAVVRMLVTELEITVTLVMDESDCNCVVQARVDW